MRLKSRLAYRRKKIFIVYFAVAENSEVDAIFARYLPTDDFEALLGKYNRFGVFMAATIGIHIYMYVGGTIPILLQWLDSGMSAGAAAAIMITGPATKLLILER